MVILLGALLMIFLLGGGYGVRAGWYGGAPFGGFLGLVLAILLVLWLMGAFPAFAPIR